MGNISKKEKLKFDKNEEEKILIIYEKYNKMINGKNVFDEITFKKEIFLNLSDNKDFSLIKFLNDFYKNKNLKNARSITSMEKEDFFHLAYILIKSQQDSEDENNLYFRKNSFFILYDIYSSKVNSFRENLNLEKISDVFEFFVNFYIKKHEKQQNQTPKFEKKLLTQFLMNNIEFKNNLASYDKIVNFIDNQLYNLDSFVKNYLRNKFYDNENDQSLITSFPILTEYSSILNIDQLLIFILGNPHIYCKKYAFKLYDCVKNGYNIQNLIYSFIGFAGPVVIFVQHFDKENNREVVLGAYLNSNFKECYENFCGDDLSFLFTLTPKLHYYRYVGNGNNPDKMCFISSKNQKFSKVIPGIGLGYSVNKCRFWIDSNECFSKSYFGKYDDVFEEGTPFDKPEEQLNVLN